MKVEYPEDDDSLKEFILFQDRVYDYRSARWPADLDLLLPTLKGHGPFARTAGFYRAIVEIEMAEDREGTLEDLATVVSQFKMPGDGLIPDYQERLKTSGAGISAREFVARGLFPMLRTLGTSRAELRVALAKIAALPTI
jgi:hypothetical protein